MKYGQHGRRHAVGGSDEIPGLGGGGSLVGWTEVVKTADQSIVNSTGLVADDELLFVTVADGVYEIEAVIIFNTPGSTDTARPSIHGGWGEDGSTIRGLMSVMSKWDESGGKEGFVDTHETNQDVGWKGGANSDSGGTTTSRVLKFTGYQIGGGGTFELLWAQLSAELTATVVLAGSVLRWRRLA